MFFFVLVCIRASSKYFQHISVENPKYSIPLTITLRIASTLDFRPINIFKKHGIRINLQKTEVMWTDEQEVDLHVVVDGKIIKQVDSFVYMGGTVREDRGSSKEVQRGCKQGTNMEEGQNVGETAKGKMCRKPACYQLVYMDWEHMH